MANWTIQSLIDGKMTVTAYCRCGRYRVLDLQTIRDRAGDIPAMSDDLSPRLTCDVCGASHPDLIYAPDDTKTPGMGKTVNAYEKAKGG